MEKMPQQVEAQQEIGHKKENAEMLIGKMSLPESVKKAAIGLLAGTIGVMAVEGGSIQSANATEIKDGDNKLEMQLPAEMQKKVDEIKSKMLDEKKIHFDNLAEKIGLEDEQIVLDVNYSYDCEQSGENPQFVKEMSADVAMEGNDVYITDYESVGVAAYDEGDSGKIWEKLSNDTQLFTIEGVEVEPISEPMSFEGTGVTENEAILNAFDRVGDFSGIMVGVERSLQDSSSETDTESIEQSMYTSSISSSYDLIIDHYKVVNVEPLEDGGYKANLEVVLGKTE